MSDTNHSLGYILPVKQGGWLRKNGTPTLEWSERGIWPTEADAQAALDSFFPNETTTETKTT